MPEAQASTAAQAPSKVVIVLAADLARMRELMERLAQGTDSNDGRISLFPAYARAIHTSGDYWHRHGLSVHAGEAMLGVGFAGRARWVNRFTGSMPLWR